MRVRQAGNVWIKLADYGISQLSTRQNLRVSNNPAGTPGFMAPELFENPGQEVSAEKVIDNITVCYHYWLSELIIECLIYI